MEVAEEQQAGCTFQDRGHRDTESARQDKDRLIPPLLLSSLLLGIHSHLCPESLANCATYSQHRRAWQRFAI